jgi:hypothetical protein
MTGFSVDLVSGDVQSMTDLTTTFRREDCTDFVSIIERDCLIAGGYSFFACEAPFNIIEEYD